jgi:hypothetical protein
MAMVSLRKGRHDRPVEDGPSETAGGEAACSPCHDAEDHDNANTAMAADMKQPDA